MLDISAVNGHTPEGIRTMLNQLRREDTNPVTVTVLPKHGSYNHLIFYDGRFPPDSEQKEVRIATLEYTAGVGYKVRSKRIQNKKHNPNHSGYNERKTQDPRKMYSVLKEVTHPFTTLEIIGLTDDVNYTYTCWVEQPSHDIRNKWGRSITENLIIDEVMHLASVGITNFKTHLFCDLVNEGIPLYNEHKRRLALQLMHMHVFIDFDGKVITTLQHPQYATKMKSLTYPNMDAVPAHIQQQVAVLKLVEANTYVPEVGQRMGDNIYWVHVSQEEVKLEDFRLTV